MNSKSVKRMLSFVAAAAMALTLLPAIPAKAAEVKEGDFGFDGTTLVKYYGNGGDVVIPEKTTEIKDYAFANSAITSLTLTKNITTIGMYAFQNCKSLSKVTITGHLLSSVSSWEIFDGDTALTTAEFTDSELTAVPQNIFANATELQSVTIPESVTAIGSGAFSGCSKYAPAKLPDSVQTIGDYAFKGTAIASLTLPQNVTTIGMYAFQNCKSLSKVTITGHLLSSVSSWEIFDGDTALTTAEFTDAELTSIPNNMFSNATELQNVSIPDSVSSIGDYAFSDCSMLKELTLPSSLTKIGYSVFKNCASLRKLTFNNRGKNSLSFSESFDPLPSNAANLTVYGYDGAGADLMVAKHNENNDIKISFSSLGQAVDTFVNPNNKDHTYYWATENGVQVVYKDGIKDSNEFISDGSYTYYVQADGTVMKDRLTYHPDGQHVIFFDANGHEVFNAFTHASSAINGDPIADGEQYYFNVYGYMYVNTVTYDATGTKLYYINPYGKLEHNGWFSFDPNAGYGDDGSKWTFTGSHLGFANYDGTLLHDAATFDYNGTPCYMQGNGEAAY